MKPTEMKPATWICWMLFFIFLAAKLFGAITWSWWYVAMPLWLPIVIAIFVLLIALPFVWMSRDDKKRGRK